MFLLNMGLEFGGNIQEAFTIQNVSIKSFIGMIFKDAMKNLQYKMFLLNKRKEKNIQGINPFTIQNVSIKFSNPE